MKKVFKILGLGLICFFVFGCMANKRRVEFINAHQDTSPAIKQAILDGEVVLGMTKEQVLASRGRPLHISKTTDVRGTDEQWIYVGVRANERMQLSKKEYKLDRKYAYIYFENGLVSTWQSEY